MIDLLIIADDFTGALDTGVQFTQRGAMTCVVTDTDIDYKKLDPDINVLSLDAETRHLSAGEAYDVVAKIVKDARMAAVPYIYKKTDSALRGNIGAELAALSDNAATSVSFVPAFPQHNRITQKGIHYIDGVPVGESVFGDDPFEPVKSSSVLEIISEQTDIKTEIVDFNMIDNIKPQKSGIYVYDAETQKQLDDVALKLESCGALRVSAGCAGLASSLAGILGYSDKKTQIPIVKQKLFVACGSVNPITIMQLDAAEKDGAKRIHLKPEEKLDQLWSESPAADKKINSWIDICNKEGMCIIDSNDDSDSSETIDYAKAHEMSLEDIRVNIAVSVGKIVKKLLNNGLDATLLITGGDTLMGFMKNIGINMLVPVCEPITGVVLSQFGYKDKKYFVLSKSGGFGDRSLIKDVMEILEQQEETYVRKV